MAEIINSATLNHILECAKALDDTVNPTMTAERFMVALMDEIQNNSQESSPVHTAARILEEQHVDVPKAREQLLTHVTHNRNMSFLDGIYMQKMLHGARARAEALGEAELTAERLLLCILIEPSEAIKKSLFASRTDTAEEGSGTVSEDPFMAKIMSYMSSEKKATKASDEVCKSLLKQEPAVIAREEMAKLVEDVKRIRSELCSSIYGQDHAVNVFATGYFRAGMLSMIDKSGRRPRGTFLFAGPPGVGKTFMAEKTAEVLKLPFMRFDMSEYADKEANIEFCGSDKVYKNGKAGNVTSFVEAHPKCVILFDEIEKAHINVIHLFLQMLDAGRLRDNFTDTEVSFRDALIILTTNAGKQLYENCEGGDLSAVSRKVIIKALEKDVNPETGVPLFPGAICSRFASGNVVMFNHIEAHHLRTIAKKEILRHASGLQKESGIRFDIDEEVYTALLFSEGSAADARTIRSRAESFFNDEIYELLRMVASDKVETGIEQLESVRITAELQRAKPEISELFASPNKPRILVFAQSDKLRLCREQAPGADLIGAQTLEKAVEVLKKEDIAFVLLDMKHGAAEQDSDRLNLEDIDSPGRELFKFLREQKKSVHIYLLEGQDSPLTEEEKTSFMRQGVRGVFEIGEGESSFGAQLETVAMSLYQQDCMVRLACGNKLITFETAQTVSRDGKHAEIKLFDFEMGTAVDAEDTKNVLSAVSRPDVRFADVIGAQEAKKELTYFVEYLKDPKKYVGTGVKAPKGVILYGSPGTGKTMLAKAMASEAGVTFIAAEGNQFLKKFVGEGSEKVHELFRTARKYAPSILFIDEIDAIAKERRGGANAGSNGEETLTAFLTEMDGFTNDPSKPVFVLAATNFDVEPGSDKSLDPALMRRFDRRVFMDLPRKEDRIRFLQMKISKNPALAISGEQVDTIAMRSTGMSLAQLDSIVELALRSAIREGSTTVTDAIFEEAFETFNSGEVRKWDASQLERVARHEAGHALLCWLGGETPSYLTIVPRGNHGGYMQHAEQEGKAIYTKEELLSRIRTSLGGRAAEIVYYGARDGISTGASGDLASATKIARQIVCVYGMDDDFGLAVMDGPMDAEVRNSVNRILKEQMQEAVKLIFDNKDKIDSLVEELLAKNHLNSAEIHRAITKQTGTEASKLTNAD